MKITKIIQIIERCFRVGVLSQEAEEQLRQLLQNTQYSQAEINAFAQLQWAVMEGMVHQESRAALEMPEFVNCCEQRLQQKKMIYRGSRLHEEAKMRVGEAFPKNHADSLYSYSDPKTFTLVSPGQSYARSLSYR